MEGIAFEPNLIEFDSLEHLASIAFESGSRVVDIYSEHEAHVFGSEVRHEYASHGPVNDVDTGHVSATDSYVGTLVSTSVIEFEQVLRVVREVGIHFEDVVVLMLNSPFESAYICSAETLFAGTLYEEEFVFELFLLQTLNYVSCAVRRAVVDDEHVELNRQFLYGANNRFDILLLVSE